MDFLTCAFILPIVLNNLINSKSSKHYGNSTDLQKQTATPFVPSVPFSTQLKDCKVVLEDISSSCGAAKLQMLDLSQDKTRTTDSYNTTESDFLKNLCLKTPIAWGNSVDKRWTLLDDKVSNKLYMCANLADTLSLLQESIYNDAANIFGHLQPKKRNLAGQKRRTKFSIELTQQKNLLLAQIKSASLPEQNAALTQLLINVKCKIRSLRKAEKTRKRRWLIKRAKNQFSVNPYKAGKNLLDPKCYCSLKVDQEVLDQHKSSNLFDNNYDIPLGTLEGLPPELLLLKKFNKSCFSYDDFLDILSSCRKASASGLNGIPYKVYKKCPRISKFLFKNFQACFKRCEIPIQWRSAQEIYFPKVSSPSENKLSDFRPIALLNVEGKLFFSLVSKCLETHLIHNNKFINNSIQKGCMEKIAGCWEHLSLVWHALKEARTQKSNLAIIWLDIANAYGSIPHKLVAFALHRYGVSPQWIRLIETYYKGIFSKSFSESATSAWHRHQRGIFAGCTLSIILFLAGMNINLEYSMQARVPKFTSNNTTFPLLRAFMDDLSLMSAKVSGAQTLLSRCITALTWAGLEFRADKSHSIVIVKGRSMNTTPFSVSKASVQPEVPSPILSIHSRPIKFLGRIIDGSISDRNSSAELKDKLLAGLSVIDRSDFTGTQKLWILQHLLIPRI